MTTSSAPPEILLNDNDNAIIPVIHMYIYAHTCTIMHYNVCTHRNHSLGIMYVIYIECAFVIYMYILFIVYTS